MSIGLLFWLLALCACRYAALAGGRDGRWAAALIILASILTIPAKRAGGLWATTAVGVLAVDSALLVGFCWLMLRSNRWWPVWMTGFHLIAVTTHFATLLAPHFTPEIYFAAETFWAIPVLLSMLIGVALDQRSGLRGLRRERAGAG